MSVRAGSIEFSQSKPFVLIAGPCQIESRDHAMFMAERLKTMAQKQEIDLIYKSSFDKANRTSHDAPRGVGMDEGLKILAEVKAEFGAPIITDIHERAQCKPVAEVADILQVPAFLSRQTDLLQAAGQTERVVMVKKGQFLAPDDMKYVAAKIAATGNEKILLCDRGTSFGYHNLVNDFRGLKIMADMGYPVVFDATHSTQSPGGQAGASGGAREMAPILARAALAVGIAALFIETHNDPDNALSDGPAMMRLEDFERALPQWAALDRLIKTGA